VTQLQQRHQMSRETIEMVGHRTGTGTGAALIAFSEILTGNLAHLLLQPGVGGAKANRQWHRNLVSISV
jgi:hypothetical protein